MASQALRKAGFIIKRSIQQASPTAKSKRSWTLRSRGAEVIIQSRDVGTLMTDRDSFHPVHAPYGSKRYEDKATWKHTNQNHPERTGFVNRATDAVLDKAVNTYASEDCELILRRYGF